MHIWTEHSNPGRIFAITRIEAQAVKQSYAEDTGSAADLHRDCFACGSKEGLGLVFSLDGTDAVTAEWFCHERYQGYSGMVHGGIIAALLDSAMTNCLLGRGIAAVTADMHIEYIEPLRVGATAVVWARLTRTRSPLFVLESKISQNGRVTALATAKFMLTELVAYPRRKRKPHA
jgi:uncharacterized protein (TIGR00369 family)